LEQYELNDIKKAPMKGLVRNIELTKE